MLLSLVEELRYGAVFPELAGARVMISGVSSRLGVDVSRGFADHRARMLLQIDEPSIEMDEVTTVLAQSAGDLKVFDAHFQDTHDATLFAKGPAQRAFGGLDVVINLIELSHADLASTGSLDDIENLVSGKLLAPTLMSRIVANRMRLTWTDGLIVNVLAAPPPRTTRDSTLASLVSATLATITRKEAERWAPEGIRINAVTANAQALALPGALANTQTPAAEFEIAALALYLASIEGAQHTGQVFDTSLVASQ